MQTSAYHWFCQESTTRLLGSLHKLQQASAREMNITYINHFNTESSYDAFHTDGMHLTSTETAIFVREIKDVILKRRKPITFQESRRSDDDEIYPPPMQRFGNMEPHQVQHLGINQHQMNPTFHGYTAEDQWNPHVESQDYRYPAEGQWKTVVRRRNQRKKYSVNNYFNEKPYRPSIYHQW